jgi:hypothetical protein
MNITQTQDKQIVTERTVVWSVVLHAREGNHMHMGVGWNHCLAAIKELRVKANEDHGDKIEVAWTGCGDQCHVWTWDAMHDAPAMLPNPDGILLDKSAGL